eukprot:15451259-Alexandrium_andersonii.AAC.1
MEKHKGAPGAARAALPGPPGAPRPLYGHHPDMADCAPCAGLAARRSPPAASPPPCGRPPDIAEKRPQTSALVG